MNTNKYYGVLTPILLLSFV